MLAIVDALNKAGLQFAFGGALALAYHIENPRATTDIDIDILVEPTDENVAEIVKVLRGLFEIPDAKANELLVVGQVRFMWDEVPVDVFTHTHEFHHDIAAHVEYVPFEGRTIPILSAMHLAVFKAFFDRPKDWVDIQEMAFLPSFPRQAVIDWLRRLLGDNYRIRQMESLENVRPKERTFREMIEGRSAND
ncbi:MAG: nucleotidyl transferase AbiEii/AbiGii toxin family protein [Acidobacteria bacterium]|nr:nucleotidyl transferase AbiEii/AbiGii toxin family protein [Acidobacteriota bacterium]